MRRRLTAAAVVGLLAMLMVAALAVPAGAEVIRGGCTGSVTFSNGTTVTESHPLDEVVEVPEADTVQYQGMVPVPEPDGPVPFSGLVDVRLPFMTWVVVDWSGETEENSDSGAYTYTVPSFVPRGTGGLEVTAYHAQQGEDCAARVTMKLAGDPGAVAILSAALTGVFGAGMAAAGMKKKG